jgi:glycosyltransferase involved in cell wall biosynthesis
MKRISNEIGAMRQTGIFSFFLLGFIGAVTTGRMLGGGGVPIDATSNPLVATTAIATTTALHRDASTGKVLSKPTIMIGGAARNVATSLPTVFASIQNVLQEFQLAGMVFYENDSTDNTPELLLQWNDEFPGKVHVLSEQNRTHSISHIVVIANARNRVMEKIKELATTTAVDYVLLLDMDEAAGHLSGVQHCLALPNHWGACCANQYRLYYDLLALSTYDDWMPCYWDDCPGGAWKRNAFRHVSASTDPISVKSCFGGAALYNWKQVMEPLEQIALYTGYDDAGIKVQCEHLSFHRNLRRALGGNFSMFIQPKMLNDGKSGLRKFVYKTKQPLWEASWNDSTMKVYYDHRLDA